MKKDKNELKSELNNYCLVIYSHINFVEQTLRLTKPIHFKNLSSTPLLQIIIESLSFMAVSYISKILEHEKRKSCSIFFLKNYINSNISDLSNGDINYKTDLGEACKKIESLKLNFSDIIEHYGNFKDKNISHIDKKNSKELKTLKLVYSPDSTLKLIQELRSILKLIMNSSISNSFNLSEELKKDFDKLLNTFVINDFKQV